ncbi:MAG: hypothetical protein J0651_05045 [Actinobacteria bacterium]|nr:hypothetical protein [Actinomycetota bacterium]
MERSNVRVGRGAPIDYDGIWLSGMTEEEKQEQEEMDEEDKEESEEESEEDRELSQAFLQRRALLVTHLHLFRKKGAIQARLTTHRR